MRTQLDCVACFIRQSLEASRFVTDDIAIHEAVLRQTLRMAADLDLGQSPPAIGQAIHRRLRELTGNPDPYRAAKDRFNRLVIGLLPDLSAEVDQAPDPLLAAARLAIAGNVIDLGVIGALSEREVLRTLREASQQPLHAQWAEFRQALAAAARVLYLADNAGELTLDRLLIEQIGPARVTVAVRGHAVINDATVADAREAGIHDLVEVISNGSDAPGTILDDCEASFRERFRQADLIIAKGQGNYETLNGVDANAFFLFKVKCPVVADQTGLPEGTSVLIRGGCPATDPRR